MPQIGTKKSGSSLGQVLYSALKGTDDIVIGSDAEATDVEGATMADAAKLIASVLFLLKGWIPFGMITGIVAEPGNGKSAFSLWLARTIVTACMWFTGLRALPKPARVLWCGTENDLAITLDRMRKWGIPEHGIILPFKDDPLRPIVLTDDSHLERIESLVNRYKTPAVFIDSLRGGHDGDENNSQVGRVLQSLSAIAQRTGAAFIVVHHTRKLSVDEEVTANSSRGSNAILALMRSQIGIDRPDPESPWRRARVLKENLGLAPKPVGFRITDK
jgi:RecA-family ATPase